MGASKLPSRAVRRISVFRSLIAAPPPLYPQGTLARRAGAPRKAGRGRRRLDQQLEVAVGRARVGLDPARHAWLEAEFGRGPCGGRFLGAVTATAPGQEGAAHTQ